MLYYFITLLAAAIVLLFNNFHSQTNRWAAFFLASASVGGLAELLLQADWTSSARIAQLINHTWTPYGLLMFCIVYTDQPAASAGLRGRLSGLLFVPAAITFIAALLNPRLELSFPWLLLWTAPYYAAACFLLIRSVLQEKNLRMKRNRLITTIIIVPTVLAVLLLINVAKAVNPDFDFFRYISVFIIYSFTIALLSTFIYGVLGVRLRFEREPLESTMQAVSSGASLLNHTLKNEIGKIAICTENLQAEDGLRAEARDQLRIIDRASDHMMAMVNRIHSQLKDIVWQAEPCRLDQLAASCVRMHMQPLQAPGIMVREEYNYSSPVLLDPVHMQEAISNLLTNAIEAMPGGGFLTVSTCSAKGRIMLIVEDTGSGMTTEQAGRVFEPFFSTKKRSLNFGLGLSYVYNVMQKCQGEIELSSKINEGTRVALVFPEGKGGKRL
ncbi:ATP-binding protein [Paenibacillus sp. GCM10027626]|uniref:sensor histidine kinase n=1 Tax=Paenibacillus sp. GCM10027626 TaxID=3273411 RepID=UPI0036323566